MVVLAMQRVCAGIGQRVVHPAHVPFVVEAKTASVPVFRWRPRHAGKARRLFGDRHRTGPFDADHPIHAAQKVDGFEVFAAAMRVRHPLARFTAVVAVEHRRHRVDTQTVDTVPLQPVERVADQVVADLGPCVVENQCLPVVVKAFARIGVFVQRRAVEIAEPVRVGWKVRWHPVENDPEARSMRGFHQKAEVFRRAEARRRRIEADRLVAPRAIERMLADGQQFKVRKTQVACIWHQRFGQFAVVEPLPVVAAP